MWEVHWKGPKPLEPDGLCFLSDALDEVLCILLDGRAYLDTRLLDDPDLPAEKRDRAADVEGALDSASGLIGRAALAGRLPMRCRDKKGGPFLDVKAEWWGVDDYFTRIAASAINLDDPWDVNAEPTHWLFVQNDALSWWTDDLRLGRGEPPIWQRAINPNAEPPSLATCFDLPVLGERKGRRGRPAASWWPAFSEELAALIHEDGIPAGSDTEGSEAMIEELLTRLSNRNIDASRTTIQPVVNATLKRLRA